MGSNLSNDATQSKPVKEKTEQVMGASSSKNEILPQLKPVKKQAEEVMDVSQSKNNGVQPKFVKEQTETTSKLPQKVMGASPSNKEVAQLPKPMKQESETALKLPQNVMSASPSKKEAVQPTLVKEQTETKLKLPHNYDSIIKSIGLRRTLAKIASPCLRRTFQSLGQRTTATGAGLLSKKQQAELRNVCWLEIHGKFDISNLSPDTMYVVVFVVMLKEISYGWEVPVNVRLTVPEGKTQEHKEALISKPKDQWIELKVGEFKTSPNNSMNMGEIQFFLYEYEGGNWKRGLLIKGVVIRPKN
ncbi:hypothetical protein GIB67_031507 [Kingdonia uniflora]|uniref:Uncharacterized protein n=1 Tax=Kingdonia uniflora TaxID=39325 RepID=A0A7J7MNC8_9MAGN|nr:hypothetical protein GIB67_031507 [Kingdonia uniflora]